MAKYPTPGRVKTRLAADIGIRRATQIYRQFLDELIAEFSSVPYAVEWRYTPAQARFRKIIGEHHSYLLRPQPSGSLGTRMRKIFENSFRAGYERVVIIGTDAPAVDRAVVSLAFRRLVKSQAVFQPTFDGGYSLIGLAPRVPSVPDMFSRIPWSTDRVMARTRTRAKALGLRIAELPPTYDVDTATDLARLKSDGKALWRELGEQSAEFSSPLKNQGERLKKTRPMYESAVKQPIAVGRKRERLY